MSRTNIDIDERLIAQVMHRYRLASKREAVDLALRRLAVAPLSGEQALALEGSGWEGDLADMRRSGVYVDRAGVTSRAKVRMAGTKSSGRLPK